MSCKFRVSVHEGEVPIRPENGSSFEWILQEESIPQFATRKIVKDLHEEGYEDSAILIQSD
jgi:hypothetical protein